jgi:3-oxoacyl-[acyl-carrier-protein] synthase-3
MLDEQLAAAGAQVARSCLEDASVELADVDMIVAAPARHGYRAALASHFGVPVERITVADDEGMHTASLVAALHCAAEELPSRARVLLIAAGAGVTAGAALYREAPHR